MVTAFSAGPQAIGYLYQPRYALYALLSLGVMTEEAAVIVEGLDDIELQAEGEPIELRQLKHVQANLTNTSKELWKTIRIWSSELSNGHWDPNRVRLTLVTTGIAPEGSAASYLRAGVDRSEEKARELLIDASQQSQTTDTTLLDCFEEFNKLTPVQQLRLLRAVTVADGTETITEIVASIKRHLKLSAPPNSLQLDALYEQLEGWWFEKVVQHLVNKSKEPLTFLEVQGKCWSLTAKLQEDNLPTDYGSAVPDEKEKTDYSDHLFVRQLTILEINEARLKKAMLDYYRAFMQRSSWVRNQLLVDDEIEVYERRLIDAWETFKNTLVDKYGSSTGSESDFMQFGREILTWMETTADIKIRPHVEDAFVMRGSFHILADADTPRVHWHPKFVERIAEILER